MRGEIRSIVRVSSSLNGLPRGFVGDDVDPEDAKNDEALRVVRFLEAKGHRERLERVIVAQGVKDALVAVLDADPLTPAKAKKLKLPAYAAPDKLPPHPALVEVGTVPKLERLQVNGDAVSVFSGYQ